ncbi:MAG: hypothetical protein ACOC0U_02985 [Desulfovibrionales bacterium]
MKERGNAFSPEEEECQKEIEELARRREECEQQIRKLREQEKPALGITFHKEIHTLLQEKLRLSVNLRIYRNKIAQLHAGRTLH